MGNSMSRLQVHKLLSPTGSTAMTIADDGAVTLDTGLSAEVDMWAMNSNMQITNSETTINAYWYRVGTSTNAQYNSFTKLGTGMTQSAGVFTFPSTGTWRIYFSPLWWSSANQSKWSLAQINLSTDGASSWLGGAIATSYVNLDETDFHASSSCETYLTVTDTSTFRVKFQCQGEDTVGIKGSSTYIYTHIIFSKITTGSS